jgi:hypothetical protein
MDEAQASAEATRRNDELGRAGEQDYFWIEVQQSDGSWTVEKRGERAGWFRRVVRALMGTPGP